MQASCTRTLTVYVCDAFHCVNSIHLITGVTVLFCFLRRSWGKQNLLFTEGDRYFKALSAISATLLDALTQLSTCNQFKSRLLDIWMSQVRSIMMLHFMSPHKTGNNVKPLSMLDNNAFDYADSICVLYYDNDFLFMVIKLFSFVPDWYPFIDICLPTPLNYYLMECLRTWINSGDCKKKNIRQWCI